ncbi:hypothetical protein FB451DRAFT_1497684 [Mycena latifolia]|nr:hypothetical protein FB451DRAFT_1497684 [Mycena latifolia]
MVFVAVQILALVAFATQFITAAPAPELVTLVAGFPAPFPSDSPETFSASIVGVDSSNAHTTYAVAQPVLSGDGSGASSTIGFVTGTLVEGSDTVLFTFAGGNIVATGLDSASHTVTTTIPAASFGSWVLDLPPTGAPGSPAPSQSSGDPAPTQSSGAPSSPAPTQSSGAPSSPAPTQSSDTPSSPAATQSGKTNSAQRTTVASFGTLVGLTLAYQLV